MEDNFGTVMAHAGPIDAIEGAVPAVRGVSYALRSCRDDRFSKKGGHRGDAQRDSRVAVMNNEDDRPVIEPAKPLCLLDVLATLAPLDEGFLPAAELELEPVELCRAT